jgi:hypothetical protein
MMNRVAMALMSFVGGTALGLGGSQHLLPRAAGAGYSTEMLVRQDARLQEHVGARRETTDAHASQRA